jgi:hypothetical protein
MSERGCGQACSSWMTRASPLVLVAVFALPALEASTLLGSVVPGELAVVLGGVLAHQGRVPLWAAGPQPVGRAHVPGGASSSRTAQPNLPGVSAASQPSDTVPTIALQRRGGIAATHHLAFRLTGSPRWGLAAMPPRLSSAHTQHEARAVDRPLNAC